MSIRDELESMVKEELERAEAPIKCPECGRSFTLPLRRLSRGNNEVTCPRCRKRITVQVD